MFNANTATKEELVRVLTPGAATNGDVTAAYSRLMSTDLPELRTMYARQVASGIIEPNKAPTQEELQAARTQAAQLVRQQVQNDPQLQADRQQVAEAQDATRKAFEDLAWSKFFFGHSQDRQGALADNIANRSGLTTTAISLTRDGTITFEALEEALAIVEKDHQLLRTTPKKPATKENLAQDEETLRKYCRSNRLSYGGESALNILRDTYGSGFGGAVIAQAVERGLVQLRSETDPQVLQQWQREDEIAHARWLRNEASPSELRSAVRAEGVKMAEQRQQEELDHSAKVTAQMQAGNYPALPERTGDGTRINRAYLFKLSSVRYEEFKLLCKKFGTAQINARLAGQI